MSTAVSQPRSEALRIVLMGVAGSGKSTIGALLASRLGIAYRDGDDLHPAANIAKMSRGEPLDDGDRWPWLQAVARDLAAMPGGIIGCSALKRRYRDLIRTTVGVPVHFVYLHGSRAVIEERMRARSGHFMPTSLVDSQFAALEPPEPDEGAVTVDIDGSPEDVVAEIVAGLAHKE